MHQSNIVRIALIAALVAAGAVAMAQNIAVLKGRGGHDNEFDAAFATLGWKPTYFACTAEGMADFTAAAERYDVALGVPLFNYGGDKWLLPKGATDNPAIKGWLEKGGVLVMTDGCYGQVREWLALIDPAFGGVKDGKCTSSQWAVLGHVRNAEPLDPLRCFPNAITEGDHWGHFEPLPAGSRWRPVAFCSEGKPVVLVQPVGKGQLVLSALRQPNAKILENYNANSQLLKSGLAVRDFALSDLAVGPGRLELSLLQDAPVGASITYEIVPETGRPQAFSTNLAGRACAMDFAVSLRGPVAASLHLNTPTGRKTLFRRAATLPALLTVSPNAYRGLLSTKRRTDDVDVKVSLAPAPGDDIANATIALTVHDGASNQVFAAEVPGPTNSVPVEMWVPLALPPDLAAGGYVLRAQLAKGRLRARSETTFEILAPRLAQAVIDEDNTFLVNGTPFFPLGIYHIGPEDFAAAADIGFNTIQFWKWHVGNDGHGVPVGLYQAMANKLRCVFESNHSGEQIWKSCAEQYGDHPAMLMWYVADEPAEGSESRMKQVNDAWHRHDKHHPTYLVSCRPDLFDVHARYADVFAFDPYGSKETPFDAVDKAVNWLRAATAATGGRQPLVVVPWATPADPGVIRPLAYASLAHDARGIVWYCWKQAGGGPVGIGLHNSPAHQEEFRKLVAEIKTMSPGLVSTLRRSFEEGAVHGMVCGDKAGSRFAVFVNVSGDPVEADIAVPELAKVKQARLPFEPKVEKRDAQGKAVLDKQGSAVLEEQPVAITDGRVQHRFKPYETRVYRW